jgi:riboflavin synthase
MFTGIVQGMATVIAIEKKTNALHLKLDLTGLARDIQLGASVSVSGVCLTVASIQDSHLEFDVIGETLAKTSLALLQLGDQVNIERSARLGDEIGGHHVSGHVSGTVTIKNIDTPPNNWMVTFACEAIWMPYILPKGFIALDGCSLTIVDVGTDWFTVHLIPETLVRTTFGKKSVGDKVNFEIDAITRAIVDTVQRILLPQSRP